ncbi:hypothetical protein [Ornithinicoccus hortensis]|uniref:Uncharacterized protein n=1 Tax=Ornithinicoccus hortensis TaxID=82346 RepID=A0A542YMM0_9MICO|nr:hypothetical protein [Ornithinicoccus hortensis]TQL49338.1 hypothetical protein FB467_0406 [Ornithinicoccus hortensis]
MTRRRLRVLLIAGLPLVFAIGLFIASAVNWHAAENKCGVLFAFDERFVDAHEVSFENRLLPLPVECRFDNGITVSHRWWPTASG